MSTHKYQYQSTDSRMGETDAAFVMRGKTRIARVAKEPESWRCECGLFGAARVDVIAYGDTRNRAVEKSVDLILKAYPRSTKQMGDWIAATWG